MGDDFNLADLKNKFEKSIVSLKDEYSAIRVGRANPAILNKVKVDYYGTLTPINQMAAVSVVEARVLVISPWDVSTLKSIEKAILQSDIGINPSNDGKVIKLIFPQLTRERRQEVVKEIGAIKEKFKISIRNSRKEALDDLKSKKKDSVISEDEFKVNERKVQDEVDKYSKKVDEIAAAKEKEILEV